MLKDIVRFNKTLNNYQFSKEVFCHEIINTIKKKRGTLETEGFNVLDLFNFHRKA